MQGCIGGGFDPIGVRVPGDRRGRRPETFVIHRCLVETLARDLQPAGIEIAHECVKAPQGEADFTRLQRVIQPGECARMADVFQRPPETAVTVGPGIGTVAGRVRAGQLQLALIALLPCGHVGQQGAQIGLHPLGLRKGLAAEALQD